AIHDPHTLSLHDALPIYDGPEQAAKMSHRRLIISLQLKTKILLTTVAGRSLWILWRKDRKHAHRNGFIYRFRRYRRGCHRESLRSEEHTSELQSRVDLVC